jgi:hypothetical protein
VSPGVGNIAEMKDIVKANVKIYLEKNRDELIESLENAYFKIGEGDAVPGHSTILLSYLTSHLISTGVGSAPQSRRRKATSQVHLEIWFRSQWSQRIQHLWSNTRESGSFL